MDGVEETEFQTDKPLLSVRFTRILAWIGPIYLLGLAGIFLYSIDALWHRGDYIGAFLAPIAIFYLGVSVVDTLCTRSIDFYEDRVVKAWYFFGERTIFYCRGQLIAPYGYPRFLMKTFAIREVDESGRAPLLQIRIAYNARFVRRETAKQVDQIVRYLTGDSDAGLRTFVHTKLPKAVICPGESR